MPGGTILMGMIDPDSPPGVDFVQGNKKSPFFQEARFYSIATAASLMQKAGFHKFEYRQTLKPGAALTDRAEPVEDGHGQGLFVVIKAGKP